MCFLLLVLAWWAFVVWPCCVWLRVSLSGSCWRRLGWSLLVFTGLTGRLFAAEPSVPSVSLIGLADGGLRLCFCVTLPKLGDVQSFSSVRIVPGLMGAIEPSSSGSTCALGVLPSSVGPLAATLPSWLSSTRRSSRPTLVTGLSSEPLMPCPYCSSSLPYEVVNLRESGVNERWRVREVVVRGLRRGQR